MKKQYHLTQAGVDELKSEIEKLLKGRIEIAEAINAAREQGDISENAEYQSARLEQERTENRINEIDHILKNADIIKQPKSADKVVLGATVELKSGSKLQTFSVVGTVEANPVEGKVSDESPIGKALLGKSVGDTVEIKLPSETKSYVIASIK